MHGAEEKRAFERQSLEVRAMVQIMKYCYNLSEQPMARFAVLAVQVIASGWNVIGSMTLDGRDISPLSFVLARMWLAVGFLSVLAYRGTCFQLLVQGRKDPSVIFMPAQRDLPRVLLVGFASGFIMPVAAIYGTACVFIYACVESNQARHVDYVYSLYT
jgi:hypothetical protein